MRKVQYKVNHEIEEVYNLIGQNFGVIAINSEDGQALNLYVKDGQWITFKENAVCVTQNQEDKCEKFYTLR